jgi:hypothetical protein
MLPQNAAAEDGRNATRRPQTGALPAPTRIDRSHWQAGAAGAFYACELHFPFPKVNMKLASLAFSLCAVAGLCAGCAHDHSTAMGAGASAGVVCKDGTTLPGNSKCAVHGGVDHQASGSGSASGTAAPQR